VLIPHRESRLMTVPNLFLIGAPKAGTTSLYTMLALHPEIFAPARKEPGILSDSSNLGYAYENYSKFFKNYNDKETYLIDGSTSYFNTLRFPWIPQNMKIISPGAKIIVILRDPIKRIISQTRQEIANGRIQRRQANLAISELSRIIDNSRYWMHINNYLNQWPENCIHLILYEEFCRSPQFIFDDCCKFLDLSSFSFNDNFPKQNASTYLSYTPFWYRRIRQKLLIKYFAFCTPKFIRSFIARYFQRRIDQDLGIDAQTIRWLHDVLRHDAQKTLNFMKKDKEMWELKS